MKPTLKKPEYRPFTKDAAFRIAKDFEFVGQEDTLFRLITRATESYQRYRLLPSFEHTKDALEKLRKGLGDSAKIAAKQKRVLESPLYGTLLRQLGELLTYEGIEKLGGRRIFKFGGLPGDVLPEDLDELTRLDRSICAAEAGPKLLVSLLNEMHAAVQVSLASMAPQRRGRRIKHFFRQAMIAEFARTYEWLFEKRPTSTPHGRFSDFCRAILQEMECDLTGLEKAIPSESSEFPYLTCEFRGRE
jgi:hypothetical protein